jgi:multiphosphoryl transfer protein
VRSIEVEVRLESGLHARPAASFVRAASEFDSVIRLENVTLGGPSADARSIVGILATGVERGHLVRITADGPDDGEAVETLRDQLVGLGGGRPGGARNGAAEGARDGGLDPAPDVRPDAGQAPNVRPDAGQAPDVRPDAGQAPR